MEIKKEQVETMSEYVLEMKGIQKSFAVPVLRGVDFSMKKGEVHALVGGNGAGKSTLMKIMTGVYQKDKGDIFVNGNAVEIHSIHDANRYGIAMIFQELSLIPTMTVAENIFLGEEVTKHGFRDTAYMNQRAEAVLKELGIDVEPDTVVGTLSVGVSQMVEIAKAVSKEAQILILDEPTASLSDSETEHLFKLIADLKAKGVSMVYISHRMDEIKVITDRVTVMRDGTYVGTLITEECTKEDIINMMVGRVIYEDPKTESAVPKDAPVVLKVEHLNAGRMVQDVSFELRKGEILGFSGLMGAGRTETARVLFGADPKESGDIYINGQKVTINNPQDAVNCGIGYLSEDRKRFGIVVQKTIAENTTMASMKDFMNGIFIDKKKETDVANQYVEALATKTPGVDELVVNLSGGNQQKVVIAKWLTRNSDILIFDEPTRGIDVGAKNEIYKLMNRLVAEGKSIIMISSEMTEILRMSDRIVVMCEGKKTGELDISEAKQETIMNLATREIE